MKDTNLNLSMRKIVRVIIVKDNNFLPIIHMRVGIALYGSRPYSKLDEHEIEQALTVKCNSSS